MMGSIGRTEMGSDPRAAFVHWWKRFIFTFINETRDALFLDVDVCVMTDSGNTMRSETGKEMKDVVCAKIRRSMRVVM